MFIGIDLGTSGVKAIVLDRQGVVRASGSAPLTVTQALPLWREQDPADWWRATEQAMATLLEEARRAGIAPAAIEALGLTGQMHGATVLDAQGQVLRPAILWNDGRASAECAELEARVPAARAITGNLVMPGFTAPKLLWLARHEPALFDRIDKVLLPKDWLRWQLSGVLASDLSDAAGTAWLDLARRDWSDELLAACGLARRHMPALHEGPHITGRLLPELARRWGLGEIPVVAGGGDNAAGAIGVGVVRPGQAMLSLGTSGVCFAVTEGLRSAPEQAVHSFCHALPGTWHTMSVMLSAASCLDFAATLTGLDSVAALLAQAESLDPARHDSAPLFLPYLNGERTPHNNPHAQAAFFGMTAATTRADLAYAVLEGVGLGLADGLQALAASGSRLDDITLIGGGSRSAWWSQLLADISGHTLVRRDGGAVGPALGAARLAWLGRDGAQADIATVCAQPPERARHRPDATRHAALRLRHQRFQALYHHVAPLFVPR
ncbi:MAG: xylulokinase [Comamonas sp.]